MHNWNVSLIYMDVLYFPSRLYVVEDALMYQKFCDKVYLSISAQERLVFKIYSRV